MAERGMAMRKAAYLVAICFFMAQPLYAQDAALAPALAPVLAPVLAVATGPLLVAVVPRETFDLAAPAPFARGTIDRLKGAIRHRFGSAMIDLYPVANSGFHFAVGTRFFRKANIQRDQQEATNGLLYVPRLPRGGAGQRGFRRATAAATMGYGETFGSNVMLGVEGGTLLGRVIQPLESGARLAGLPGGGRDEPARRLNPVLNLTLGYAF